MDDYVKDVCAIGQGAECCRYLMMTPHGFECGKLNEFAKPAIDARVHEMTAKGDNCEGREL